MTSGRLLLALALAAILQMSTACKNCVALGKAEKAMFAVHSGACLPYSGADPRRVRALLAGELAAAGPELRRHVYCVLRNCKLVGKDGKLVKGAARGKLTARPAGDDTTKILESCVEQSPAASPEDAAWNLFRCGYDRKVALLEHMSAADNQPQQP